ncbi:hypothetical protein Sa4125_17550 [Aureimonas sp. SA4125]|uniref:winged helix-turn-helix domain-containing protein n=1 Tax=Aureimonas sp. SA4125 TaxID=2826993 RepID=UPI001CC40C87|nr:winged helix-turn-helix domain-containing protein [Aureimonas sp. SA4125]BDA84213.1 hypothetical protein Sa4125_17550 [Aureimonas sp. SA4125]
MHTGATLKSVVDLIEEQPAGPLTNVGAELSFGRYVALPNARTLLLDGNVVCLGARAFDLLVLLLTHQGQIVSKEVMARYVWPSTIVDESNLRFQITCLRKALGEERDRIKTVSGRGYLFVPDDTQGDLAARESLLTGRVAGIARSHRKPDIVVIDEDPANREALCRLLRPFDANVLSFASIEAFHKSSSGAISVHDVFRNRDTGDGNPAYSSRGIAYRKADASIVDA